MWAIYAFIASLMWGLSYAVSGWLFTRGLKTYTFFLCSCVAGALLTCIALFIAGRFNEVIHDIKNIRPMLGWMLIACLAFAFGNLNVCFAISEKNATMAAILESTYPLFVAFAAWILFNEVQLSMMSLFGSSLIIVGSLLVAMSK